MPTAEDGTSPLKRDGAEVFHDLLEYRKNIKEYANGKEEVFVLNSSIVHASLIMGCFFESSKSSVNMYCGEFSIFRDAFKEKLKDEFASEIYDSVRNRDDFKNFKPYEDCIRSLVSFLDRKGELNVITDRDITSIKKEKIWGEIEKHVGKSLRFYLRNDPLGHDFHYTVAEEKMYRTENNDKKKTAICCFQDKQGYCNVMNGFFGIMKRRAKEIKFN
jgi:hypothetical protein